MKKPCIFVLNYKGMRLFLFISITLISLSLNAQKQNYKHFESSAIYELTNNTWPINLKIYQKNNKLNVETDFQYDTNGKSFHLLKLNQVSKDMFFFKVEAFLFILDLTQKNPILICVNPIQNDIKNPIFN